MPSQHVLFQASELAEIFVTSFTSPCRFAHDLDKTGKLFYCFHLVDLLATAFIRLVGCGFFFVAHFWLGLVDLATAFIWLIGCGFFVAHFWLVLVDVATAFIWLVGCGFFFGA